MDYNFPKFYKKFGARTITNLLTPKIASLKSLPLFSLLHLGDPTPISKRDIGETDKDIASGLSIDPEFFLFEGVKKKINVDYNFKLPEGSTGIKKSIEVNGLVRGFHRKNHRFLYTRKAAKLVENDRSLVVIHHDYIHACYRYGNITNIEYSQAMDFISSMYFSVAETLNDTNRNQFIFIRVPERLPPFSVMKQYSTSGASPTLLKHFDTAPSLMFLDLFRFISPKTRALSKLSVIPVEKYTQVNFLFATPDNRCSVINLAYLISFITGEKNLTDFKSITQMNFERIQKLFVLYLNNIGNLDVKNQDFVETSEIVREEYDNEERNEILNDNYDDGDSDSDSDSDHEKSNDHDEYVHPDLDTDITVVDSEDIDQGSDLSVEQLEKEIDRVSELETKVYLRSAKVKDIKLSETEGEDSESEKQSRYLEKKEIVDKLYMSSDTTIEERLTIKANELLDNGFMTAKEYNSYLKTLKRKDYETVNVKKIDESKIKFSKPLAEPSYANNSLDAFRDSYTDDDLQADIENVFTHLQRAGVVVKKVERSTKESVLGTYDQYTVTIDPIDGMQSTIHLKIPKIDKDGYFTANGKKNIMRLQIADIPIRKISPTRVQLSSYYGKTFITRSRTKTDSFIYKVMKAINATVDPTAYITKIALGDYFFYEKEYPYVVGQLSSNYLSIETQDFVLDFSHEELKKRLGDSYESKSNLKKYFLVGWYKNSDELIYSDKEDNFYRFLETQGTLIGNISDLLKLDISKSVINSDFTNIRIYSKEIPVALILVYFMGIDVFLNNTGIKYRVEEKTRRLNDDGVALAIPFKDSVLLIEESNSKENIMLAAGLFSVYKSLKKYTYSSLNNKDYVADLLFGLGFNAAYIKEVESQEALFVDNITMSALESYGEPTAYLPLLIRANQMLVDYTCAHPQNASGMRLRGNERIAGYIYKELAYALRDFRNRNISFRSKVEISPYKVWDTITKDNSVKLAEETNPVQALKEKELITYLGEGGRSKESMPKDTRVFHESFTGLVSEASVDNSDVGINSYLSPAASITNTRGLIGKTEDGERGLSSVFSTSALLAPFSMNDDMKRMNFISIQNSHIIGCPSYDSNYVTTGYESVVAKRSSSHLFSTRARADGKIELVTDKLVVIRYMDGTVEEIEIGIIYGRSEGKTYGHKLVTDVKVGDFLKKDEVITYNETFFKKDKISGEYVYKTAINARVALIEGYETHEDSSCLSSTFASKLHTSSVIERSVVVKFTQRLTNPVKIGDQVDADSPLIIIEDELSSNLAIFTEEQLATLADISRKAPKAKHKGVIEDIEVFYHGDKDDMSPMLKKIATEADARLRKKHHVKNINGYSDDSYQVAGKPLQFQTAEIKFYIRKGNGMTIGDKVTFANQMKSVVGEILKTPVRDDMGNDIDALFGMRSVANRIVFSPFLIGTTATILRLGGEAAVKMYEDK